MIKINKNTTVSFDIDAQNGFTPNCPNELPVIDGDLIVSELNANAKFAKYRYASKDTHPATGIWTATKDKPQFSPVDNEKNVDVHWKQHCVVGTFGFELLSGLPVMADYDFFVYKGAEKNMHPYSPCYHDLSKKISTGIIEKAKYDGITTFILGGLALDYCLGEGAYDLYDAGFEVIVNLSATKAIGGVDEWVEKAKLHGIKFVNGSNELELI